MDVSKFLGLITILAVISLIGLIYYMSTQIEDAKKECVKTGWVYLNANNGSICIDPKVIRHL